MRTSHSLLRVLSHKANIRPTRLWANWSFRDAILGLLHSVSCQYNRDLWIRLFCKGFFISIFHSKKRRL